MAVTNTRTQGGEHLTIDKTTFEVKGQDTGKVYGTGTNLQEALALQTQIASGGTPTVKGRPDLYAVAPTASETSAGIQDVNIADAGQPQQMVTPTVATPDQLAQRTAGTLPSAKAALAPTAPEAPEIQAPTDYATALKEATSAGAQAGVDAKLEAGDSYDSLLDKQKALLYEAYFGRDLTPDDLKWLTPAQVAAVTGGEERMLKGAIAGLESIVTARSDRQKEEEAQKKADENAAYAKIEMLGTLGMLSVVGDDVLQGLSDATGLSVSDIRGIQTGIDAQNRQTSVVTIGTDNNGEPIKALMDSQTGETIKILTKGEEAYYSTSTTGGVTGSLDDWAASVGNDTITQNFDTPVNYFKDGRTTHSALDIDGEIGDPIYTPISGKVVEAQSSGGWGTTVVVEDSGGNKWRFAHFDSANVSVGDEISAGTMLGTMGNTGHVIKGEGGDGSHLHMEVKNANGSLINPANLLTNETTSASTIPLKYRAEKTIGGKLFEYDVRDAQGTMRDITPSGSAAGGLEEMYTPLQLSKAAELAGVSYSEFANWPIDQASPYLAGSEDETTSSDEGKSWVYQQLYADDFRTVKEIKEEFESLMRTYPDTFTDEDVILINDYLKTEGIVRDAAEGNWKFGDYIGDDPKF